MLNVLKAPLCMARYNLLRLVDRRLDTKWTAYGTRQEVPGPL